MDIFQAVKSARIQRPGLLRNVVGYNLYYFSLCNPLLSSNNTHDNYLSTQEQYAFCHEVLADFVNSYDNYANFKDIL